MISAKIDLICSHSRSLSCSFQSAAPKQTSFQLGLLFCETQTPSVSPASAVSSLGSRKNHAKRATAFLGPVGKAPKRCKHSFSQRLLRALLQPIGCYVQCISKRIHSSSQRFRAMQGKHGNQSDTGSHGFLDWILKQSGTKSVWINNLYQNPKLDIRIYQNYHRQVMEPSFQSKPRSMQSALFGE